MKTMVQMAGGLALTLMVGSALADEFAVQGKSASGRPGERVFVEAVYDYGAGLGFAAEDLQFEYQFDGMTFVPEASTVGAAGAGQNLSQYLDALRTFAQGHGGGFLVNPDAPGSTPDFKGYALSFYTLDGALHHRSAQVHLNLAFDILSTAMPGVRKVSFTDKNVLIDQGETEFSYPLEMQQLSVTVVPEPQIAWMLLPGLALVGLYTRRRTVRKL